MKRHSFCLSQVSGCTAQNLSGQKNPAPSNFSRKLRIHVKGRRLEKISQLGIDRIVDLQFGSNEAAYHIIVELYDRGNIILTDSEYTILNILRARTDNNQDVRFAVREIYPFQNGKAHELPTEEKLLELLKSGKNGDPLKKILIPNLDYGPAVIEHSLLSVGFPENVKVGSGFDINSDLPRLISGLTVAEELLTQFLSSSCKGYILQKKDKRSNPKGGEPEEIVTYEEYHPFLFKQHEKRSYVELESFDKAVDEFYSKLESQKLDLKVVQHEKSAMKKLDNVKKDHEKRIQGLQKEQESDILKGQLIEMNLELVDQAILIVRSALANQIDWTEIWALVKEAQINGDPVALAIKGLKLDTNQITVLLSDPFPDADEDDEESQSQSLKPMKIDLDLSISAYGNSRKYFDRKKQAAKKEQKTAEASNKAFKSAEKKTKQSLKEVQTAVTINKTRKTYWFEKFLWFISSENYLVIGGRDQQQNEMIVKRYMRTGDLYVHADLHGASSCIIKNPKGGLVPPKTLNEAGTMAICNSAAWDSKVITSAWWVHQEQVSKTAPSGEYLTTGSFMIRGKKNYLPPSYLIYGFGFLFKLEDGSIEHHLGERKVRTVEDDDDMSVTTESGTTSVTGNDDIHLDISDGETSSDEEKKDKDEGSDEEKKDKDEGKGDGDNFVSTDQEKAEVSPNSLIVDQTEEKSAVPAEELETATNHMESLDVKDELGIGRENDEDLAVKKNEDYFRADEKKDTESDFFAFPDTTIKLQHVKGDKYELQSQISNTSTNDPLTFEPIYLGDSQPVVFGEKVSGKTRLSAKQRRDMKKNKKNGGDNKQTYPVLEEHEKSWLQPEPNVVENTAHKTAVVKDIKEDEDDEDSQIASSELSKKKNSEVQAPPSKRGQKSKKKKIKEKYADQDEEERILKMEILASAGSYKKKKKKEKEEPVTGSTKKRPSPFLNNCQGKGAGVSPPQDAGAPSGEAGLVKGKVESNQEKVVVNKEDDESDGEKEENAITDDTALLNSLTGIPISEDELLYAVPVCAPYNSLLNYKFKVKLMPGSSKKGKAVKTALAMFLHDRATTGREKDLLKIQKDVDLSRNLPGKVKVAAPNLHKSKR